MPLLFANSNAICRSSSISKNNILNKVFLARLIMVLQVAVQFTVIVTEAISNSKYKLLSASSGLLGYTGQSLLVIIISIVQICIACLIFRNLKFVLSKDTFKIAFSCIGLSMASIFFRTFTSSFLQYRNDSNYMPTYNATSICMVIGIAVWIPFVYCKGGRQASPTTPMSTATATDRQPPASTYRPNNEQVDDELPSYYEMAPPPAYKKKHSTSDELNTNESFISGSTSAHA